MHPDALSFLSALTFSNNIPAEEVEGYPINLFVTAGFVHTIEGDVKKYIIFGWAVHNNITARCCWPQHNSFPNEYQTGHKLLRLRGRQDEHFSQAHCAANNRWKATGSYLIRVDFAPYYTFVIRFSLFVPLFRCCRRICMSSVDSWLITVEYITLTECYDAM